MPTAVDRIALKLARAVKQSAVPQHSPDGEPDATADFIANAKLTPAIVTAQFLREQQKVTGPRTLNAVDWFYGMPDAEHDAGFIAHLCLDRLEKDGAFDDEEKAVIAARREFHEWATQVWHDQANSPDGYFCQKTATWQSHHK